MITLLVFDMGMLHMKSKITAKMKHELRSTQVDMHVRTFQGEKLRCITVLLYGQKTSLLILLEKKRLFDVNRGWNVIKHLHTP